MMSCNRPLKYFLRLIILLILIQMIYFILKGRKQSKKERLVPMKFSHLSRIGRILDVGVHRTDGDKFMLLEKSKFHESQLYKIRKMDFLEYLAFVLIVDEIDDEEVMSRVRGFVGGVHRLKVAPHKLPKIILFVHSQPNVYTSEEISVWSKVKIIVISEYLGMKLENHPLIKNHLLYRVSVEFGHVIWVKLGYIFDPAGISYRKAEGTQNPTEIRSANEYSRKFVKSLYQAFQTNGYLQVVDPKNQDVVLEGYSYGHEGFQVLLDKTANSKRYEIKDFGLVEYSPRSNVSCHIDVKEEAIKNFALLKSIAESRKSGTYVTMSKISGMRKLVVGFPTTSKGMSDDDKPIFFKAILPTLLDTLTPRELNKCLVDVYIGFDHGDPVFDNEDNIKRYIKRCEDMFQEAPIIVKFFRFPKIGRIGMLWSMLFAAAMRDGAFYFYQVNDDLRLVTKGWLTKFARALDQNRGIGVAGPADNFVGFNCTLLTQAMVTRKHFEIFGTNFYPVGLRDWKTDLWLSRVYGMENTFCWHDYVANNGAVRSKRYQHCPAHNWKVYLESGQKLVELYKNKEFN